MAQADFFLKIDGLDGESQDDKHKNEIEIRSFNFNAVNAGSGGQGTGSGSGKVNIQDMTITKTVDKASPNLFIGCCTGKHYPMATITCRKAGEKPHEYLVFKLTEAFVSSINISGHDGGGVAQESLSLNFTKVEVIYTPQNADGSPGAKNSKSWNILTNVAT
jgi:type VI secretion system secreted protein Hcp